MMGVHQPQNDLFSSQVNLDKPMRADHPLRRVAQAVDLSLVRAELPAAAAITAMSRSIQLIRKYLIWEPNIRLRDGLEKTYAWIYGEMTKGK